MSEQKTFSISVRLRRTIFEEAYVSIALDQSVTFRDPAGQVRVDGDKVMKAAVLLGTNPSVRWSRESEPTIDLHPIQKSPSS